MAPLELTFQSIIIFLPRCLPGALHYLHISIVHIFAVILKACVLCRRQYRGVMKLTVTVPLEFGYFELFFFFLSGE